MTTDDLRALADEADRELKRNKVNCYMDGKDRFSVGMVMEAARALREAADRQEELEHDLEQYFKMGLQMKERAEASDRALREAAERIEALEYQLYGKLRERP